MISSARSAFRLAWKAAAGWLAGYVALIVVAAVLPVTRVWLLKDVLDALTTPGHVGLPIYGLGLVMVGLAASASPPVTGYLHNQAGRLIGRRARSDLFLAIGRLAGLARAEDPVFRNRLQLAQQIGRSGPAQVVDGTLAIGQSGITLAGLFVVLAAVSPLAAGFALLSGVPALVAQIRLSRARAGMLWRISPVERRELFYADLQTNLRAAKELRLLGLSELFRTRMLRELAHADHERRQLDRRELRLLLGLDLLSALVSGGGLVWAIGAATHGPLTIGDLSAFVAGTGALLTGIATLVGQVAYVHHALLNYGHFQAVLDTEPDLPLAAEPRPVPALRHGIELRDVWFRYSPDQEWVLRGVNLVIPHGRAVALVGLNGAGKSTLVKLLCRFYDPDRGAVLWDGIDLREVAVTELRERIGAVFQDYMTYDLTASENIGLGEVSALDDAERIQSSARRAGIHQTLASLPRGYRTLLSRVFADPGNANGIDTGAGADDPETGVLLSGGQWQRLALARAFMRDQRDLLILDEPSSGLDAAAEYEIHHGLRRHRAGATSMLISHRLGAIRDADWIVVLADGRIVEEGTHSQLLAADGEYARLFRMQAEGYRRDGGHQPSVSRA